MFSIQVRENLGTDPVTAQAICIIFACPPRIMRHFGMGTLGTRPSFSGLEVRVSGCGFAQLPNHLTTEPPNQRLGTDPKFPVCVTLPRRSIVRERAGSAASAKRQGRCDGCIFMAGIISKNQSARQARSCPSLRQRA